MPTPTNPRVAKLIEIRRAGMHLIEQLTAASNAADADLKFLEDTYEILGQNERLRHQQDMLRPILNARKSMTEFRRDTQEMALAELQKYMRDIICSECNGQGETYTLPYDDTFRYETCKTCGGSGAKG